MAIVNPSAAFFNCTAPAGVVRNFFNLAQYACATSFFGRETPLPTYEGYLIILTVGIGFAILCTCVSWYDYKYLGAQDTAENFVSAGRTIKIGLVRTPVLNYSKMLLCDSLIKIFLHLRILP